MDRGSALRRNIKDLRNSQHPPFAQIGERLFEALGLINYNPEWELLLLGYSRTVRFIEKNFGGTRLDIASAKPTLDEIEGRLNEMSKEVVKKVF